MTLFRVVVLLLAVLFPLFAQETDWTGRPVRTNEAVGRSKIDSLKSDVNKSDSVKISSASDFDPDDYRNDSDSTDERQEVDSLKSNAASKQKKNVDDGILYNQYLDFGERDKYYSRTEIDTAPLQRYGESFIRSLKNSFPKYGPVSSSYRIGLGDEIVISIWGEVQSNERLRVDRSGRITPQGIGAVSAAGRTIDDLKKSLLQRYSQIYSGVRNGQSSASTFVDVTMGELRTKQVFVVGNVANPGTYSIPSSAGILGALAFAGGPTASGSLREVIIKRGGKVVGTIDCYEYLLLGKVNDSTTLADMDVVLVPTVKKSVAVSGAVYTPAIFELKDRETFKDLLRYAGGYKPEAYTRSINVTRTLKHNERRTITVFESDTLSMMANDSLAIPFVDQVVSTVSVEGAVKRPGSYGLFDGMTLKDLIKAADGVSEDCFYDRAEVVRTYGNFDKRVIAVNIGNLLKGDEKENVVLQKWDIVKLFSKWDVQYRHYVSIYGEVKNPGKYFLRDSMTVQDLILLAGGFTDKAFKDTVELSRVTSMDRSSGNATTAIAVAGGDSFYTQNSNLLVNMDNVFVRENSSIKEQEVVCLRGEFRYPGFYAKTSENETLLSLVKRAGGIKPSAYLEGARFVRGKDSIGVVAVNVKRLIEKGRDRDNIILEHGDTLTVPTVPKTVAVDGAVNYPTSVKFEARKNIRYYIRRAGGFSSTANSKSIYVILANGEVRQVRKSSSAVNAGSAVVVPEITEKKEKFNWTAFATTMVSIAATSVSLVLGILTFRKSN